MRRLNNSILKDEIDISYVKQIYRSMDKIYDNLGIILYEMVKKAVKKYRVNLSQLIIDGTRLKVFTDEETGLVKFGYSGKNGKLPQINLVLAVNDQQIPFFVETYPGNESDIAMFKDFIKHLRHRYRFLSKKVKKKVVVFDQGNVGKATIKAVHKFKKNGIHFISMVRTNSIDKYVKKAKKEEMKLIYEKKKSKNKRTRAFGKQLIEEVYGIESNIILCYNPNIRKKKLKTLNTKIKRVKDLAEELNKKDSEIDDKLDEVKVLIKKYNFKRLIKPEKTKDKITLEIDKEELKKRKARCGFFALFSNDMELTPEEMIKTYKSKDLVEKGFKGLKSDIEIEPIFHHTDNMKETHAIMVIYGYFLASLLRSILKQEYSFEELLSIIKSGNVIEGYYESNLIDKKLYIFRPIKQSDELRSIFRRLKIKVPKYEIKNYTPTG